MRYKIKTVSLVSFSETAKRPPYIPIRTATATLPLSSVSSHSLVSSQPSHTLLDNNNRKEGNLVFGFGCPKKEEGRSPTRYE